MLTRYKDYIISWSPGSEDLAIEKNGIFYKVPCKYADGYAIKINKRSVSADGGARGVFSFMTDCIKKDFMMCYVDRILQQFCGA